MIRRLKAEWRLLLTLTIYAGFLASVATKQSPVWDGIAHLPAGISHWNYGSFDLYRVNPPFPRMVAVLPILAIAETDWENFDSNPKGSRPDFHVGKDFVNANRAHLLTVFYTARMMSLVFALVGAITCFCFATELYGRYAGWIAMAMWCLSPNVIAWSTVVMPDVPASAFGLMTVYLFWRWIKQKTVPRGFACGFVLGVALLC